MKDDIQFQLLFGKELHEKVIVDAVLNAARTVWIATADLKDMHIQKSRGYEPVLTWFERMAKRGVRFRIIHSNLPTKPFQKSLDNCPSLTGAGLELQICPRSHWKLVVVDSRFAYFGSANFTGAGLGVKNENRRNLELGAITTCKDQVAQIEDLFDSFWIGDFCRNCAFATRCPDPIC